MNITEAFVLKNDVVLIPCAELTAEVRERIAFDDGDFTLSRRHGRSPSQVIDGETAGLLSLFREPRTIVEAVLENSRSLGKNPQSWLDELIPHLGVFLRNHVLVPAGSEDEKEIRPQFESGASVAGWEIVRCVSLIEDSEVYQVRNGSEPAALKMSRAAVPFERSLFGNEAAILRHLDVPDADPDATRIAPRLRDSGSVDDRAYLIIDWVPGVESTVAAAQRRHDRAAVIELCAAIAEAYAALHARGVLHSDVHPRNVLVGDRGKVTLLDYGFSRLTAEAPRVGRAGMFYFFEPEFLAAQRAGVALPSSEAGEQYALAALLYFLIAGRHYLDFRFDREEMGRQVESDPPLSFATRGLPPCPAIEEILLRALEKDPARRFSSVAEMATQLGAARDAAAAETLAAPLSDEAHAFLAAMLRSFSRGGALFRSRYATAPTASINNGAAGAAAGLLRIAEVRSDPALLALAEVWKSRALALVRSDGAYYNEEIDLPRAILGEISPYHTEAGVHAAAALVSAAMGDRGAQGRSIAAFIAASRRPCEQLDLTLGRSGTLLAASMLMESDERPRAALPEPRSDGRPRPAADAGSPGETQPPRAGDSDGRYGRERAIPNGSPDLLHAFGSETMKAIWNELDTRPALPDSPPDTYLGVAHGWAGYCYAALRWCAASGDELPRRLVDRLHEYKALQMRKGRGVYWRRTLGSSPFDAMPGWCNGSAGAVFLFTLAHRLLGEPEWLELAELSAWHAWDEPRGTGDLCCGSAGRAYAMLNLYKHTGATEWLSRARQLANHAAISVGPTAQRPNSLWKGELGVAVLIADLASPENAAMPFFE